MRDAYLRTFASLFLRTQIITCLEGGNFGGQSSQTSSVVCYEVSFSVLVASMR